MKWYFASRMKHKSKITDISKFLKDRGETVISEWIYKDSLKPYKENISKIQPFSEEVVSSLLDTDIFVLISDPEGTDMFIELGICLAKKILSKNIKIYIVGEYSKRSLMQLHPSIIHARNIEEVFNIEKIDLQGVKISVFNF
jgi:hypothetical protein